MCCWLVRARLVQKGPLDLKAPQAPLVRLAQKDHLDLKAPQVLKVLKVRPARLLRRRRSWRAPARGIAAARWE